MKISIKHLIIAALAGAATIPATAQDKSGSNWFFGNKAGLNLEDVPYVMEDGQLLSSSTCASISTPNGDLRCYTNGVTLWNGKHLIVQGGNNLKGNVNASQGAVIIPKPEDAKLFYIFTTPANGVDGQGGIDSLRYSVVDMTANTGLGVVTPEKNIALFGQVEEKVTAIYSPDGTYAWLLAHGFKNNKYIAYKLTANGISAPVVSSVGEVDDQGGRGCMKFSPDGKHVARALTLKNKAELLNFDMATGVVSAPIVFNGLTGVNGVEFSSYSNRLYFTTVAVGKNLVNQYNINLTSADEIVASKTIINTADGVYPTALQLGYNGLIYSANAQSDNLGIITNADTSGLQTQLTFDGVALSSMVFSGLPAFCQNNFARVMPPPVQTSINMRGVLNAKVFPNPSTDGIFYFTTNSSFDKLPEIKVANAAGIGAPFTASLLNGQLVLDLSMNPSGIYLAIVNIGGRSVEFKLFRK